MDKDIKKILSVIMMTVLILGLPTAYFLWRYSEVILEIEAAEKITLPEEDFPEKTETPGKNEKDTVRKDGESVIGNIFDEDSDKNTDDQGEPDEDTDKPEENPDEIPDIAEKVDTKEGLIIDNSSPNPFDKNNPTVNFGPTTGKMGSKVNQWDVSGFKQELANEVHKMVGDIKTDPKRVLDGHIMTYFSEDISEKIVENVISMRVQEHLMGKKKELTPPESLKIGDADYLVTTMDVWKLKTEYNNPEGILNEIKIQTPDFLRAAFLPSYGGYSYNYGVISVYFNTETDKNEVVMVLYNFVKITE